MPPIISRGKKIQNRKIAIPARKMKISEKRPIIIKHVLTMAPIIRESRLKVRVSKCFARSKPRT